VEKKEGRENTHKEGLDEKRKKRGAKKKGQRINRLRPTKV
jgi:hypothetical protein